jgi:hypothetical protein
MAGLVLTFENNAHAIKAVGDLSSGWQPYQDGHGFFGLARMDFAGDILRRVTLQVHARPNRYATFVKEFPRVLVAAGGTESLCYKLEGGVIAVFADLGKNITWLDGARKLGINWRAQRLRRTCCHTEEPESLCRSCTALSKSPLGTCPR